MTGKIDTEAFLASVGRIARAVDPILRVIPHDESRCTVLYPGLGDQVWVKVGPHEGLFHVFKSRLSEPKPAHLGLITPAGADFLRQVLSEYVEEVGHPNIRML
ncbi:hypothetical protein [Gloeobacter morelensis]|uniref:Uncharacterized protein n=1 Tax=Gloeobacter morelensis MG652769 TaxID=2781736 RepID=A0ABY3PT44_9CYAN|nr:hypothetical protein [Gloeobacter morelensis]UFP96667.1 hypothetical protein ISF26_10840 [Gloeobacter morelensis MG652769]